MRSGAIRRKRALSALITGVHIAEELAEPCRSSTGVPKPAAITALRRIGRAVLIQAQFVGWVERLRNPSPLCRSRWVSLRSTHPTAPAEQLLRRHARCLVDLFHLGGAILELGDFPERIERRIGKQVRRRLHI